MSEHHLEIEHFKLKILKTISEGGFGIVYLVENDSKQGPKMALKKIITQDPERYRLALKELNFLKSYCSTPSNVFINYMASKVTEDYPGKHTFYILIEFCGNGTLFDLMAGYMQKQQRFSEEEILTLLKALNACLLAMHALGVIHCDFKIENLLFFNWESVKLCDFGSVNNFSLDFAQIPKAQFYNYELLFEKQTTLMYRPPEMCDLFLGLRVNNKVDMWMLGCVLFTLMFFKHPFHESSKLSIVSASFFWPEDSPFSEKLENLTRNLLTPNPDFRPSALDVRDILENWEKIEGIELNKMALGIKKESAAMRKNLNWSYGSKNEKSREKEGRPQKASDFDFSGLDRLSKKTPAYNHSRDNKSQNGKLNSFNFMNLDFGETAHSEHQSHSLPTNETRFSLDSTKRNRESLDVFEVGQKDKQAQNPTKPQPNNFDPFDIDFSENN